MSHDTPNQLPKRAFEEDAPLEQSGLAAFRARVQRVAVPAVLTLAVSAGLTLGGIVAKGSDDQTLTAAPAAPVAMADRQVDQPSRSDERAPLAEPTPDALPAETAPPAEAPAAPADAQALRKISFAPTAAPSTAKATGKMYATAGVKVRSQANAGSAQIGSVRTGDSISVTGRTDNGFSQVVLNGRNGWVSSKYLSSKAPAPAAAPARSAAAARPAAAAPAAAPGGGRSCAPLPGLAAGAASVHQALCAGFPAVSSYGGVRPDWDDEHPSGRAIDAMVSSIGTGDAVANWARANAASYGITEVIWNQRIWTSQRGGEGWRAMGDRGSATANHRDHVHISVR